MKRAYEKPKIIFESFVMSTNIAGDCEEPYVKNPTKGSCGVPPSFGDDVLWSVNIVNGCNAEGGSNGTTSDGLCYHNPSDSNNLFNS